MKLHIRCSTACVQGFMFFVYFEYNIQKAWKKLIIRIPQHLHNRTALATVMYFWSLRAAILLNGLVVLLFGVFFIDYLISNFLRTNSDPYSQCVLGVRVDISVVYLVDSNQDSIGCTCISTWICDVCQTFYMCDVFYNLFDCFNWTLPKCQH